ncbi:HAD family hydrolase [Miniphocaeibacter massiliensis]|uniref:HAD family hydrolase n=1 Tax=Miniphocaeibacter massiliensis TaxID=2041841 RepID=UPI001F5E1056|nr:HAD family hydrolase [Miniphocaeibacter massiliensis]
MMFKAYVFDLDGTIIDSIKMISSCFNDELKKISIKPLEENLFNYFVGDGPKVLVDKAFEYIANRDNTNYDKVKLTRLKDDFLKNYLESYNNVDDNYSTLYPGIKESLEYLKRNNKKLAICTNKPLKATKNVLKINFGENYFDYVIGLEDETKKKPDPYMMNRIMKELNLKCKDIAYFGDTSTDMLTAKNVNVYAVGVLWGFREKEELIEFGADKIISDPLDIMKI